jgi:uroporphyrin-III C-methyltransferase
VTAHARAGEALDLDWATLADPEATLAVYMGKAAAEDVSRQLIAAGLPPDTAETLIESASLPEELIESASLPEERQFRTRLDLLPLVMRTALGDDSGLLLIGKAMQRALPDDGGAVLPVPAAAA